jgi:hypothetical protein
MIPFQITKKCDDWVQKIVIDKISDTIFLIADAQSGEMTYIYEKDMRDEYTFSRFIRIFKEANHD